MHEARAKQDWAPFALAQRPAGDDPQRDHEDEQDGARADGHQRLEDETGVEVDAVESADAARRRIGEELAVQQHDAANEVETQEHGKTERYVDGNPFGADDTAMVGQFGRP